MHLSNEVPVLVKTKQGLLNFGVRSQHRSHSFSLLLIQLLNGDSMNSITLTCDKETTHPSLQSHQLELQLAGFDNTWQRTCIFMAI